VIGGPKSDSLPCHHQVVCLPSPLACGQASQLVMHASPSASITFCGPSGSTTLTFLMMDAVSCITVACHRALAGFRVSGQRNYPLGRFLSLKGRLGGAGSGAEDSVTPSSPVTATAYLRSRVARPRQGFLHRPSSIGLVRRN
jgi:hypothetical protein